MASLHRRAAAEFLGTFWLVFGGCGSAVLAAAFPQLGHRLPRRGAGLRPDGADHGVRHRAHLRLPSQPGGLCRALGGGKRFPAAEIVPLHGGAGVWGPSPARPCCM